MFLVARKLPGRSELSMTAWLRNRLACTLLATLCFLNGLFLACAAAYAQQIAAYRNPNLPIEQRVADLLSRMTLEEKVAQLESAWENPQFHNDPTTMFIDQQGNFLPDRAAVLLKDGIGEISRPGEGGRSPRNMAEYTNTVQQWMKDHTRLGIPVLFHEECLHGHVALQATSYPQAIALASTWDPGLLQEVFAATAAEVRAAGAHRCLAPVLDIARDPRWGRTEETYGEDPYLVSRLGVAAIEGFQGHQSFLDKTKVFATAKHFAVHGQPEGGNNVAPGNYSERVVREYFLKPFAAAVMEAHVQSVMPSYNEVDGIPSHSNKHLLGDILRREWGFDGLVVSDYFGITELMSTHRITASREAAARFALDAGVDLELPFEANYGTLVEQVQQGKVAVSEVDGSVGRVLRQKFQAGLFENAQVDPAYAERLANSPEHPRLALQAAREAIVLLKNQNQLLPLDVSKYQRIAVIGPNAAEVHLGGYSGKPGRGVSLLQGIKDKVGSRSEIIYAEGCKITETPPDWDADKVVLGDPTLNSKRIQDATSAAKNADLIILALGDNEQTSREAWSNEHLGDRASLALLGNQDDLVKAMLATGKPVVVVLLQGRPNAVTFIAENVPAILNGWYLGQEGGTAMADVLFGDSNPGGKLPITVPRSVGQLPDYYYQKPSAKRPFLDSTTEPLYPFGWGLSYSTFRFENLRVFPREIGPAGTTTVSVDVKNISGVRGQEVVQLYIRDEFSSVTRPVKELRGFRRISFEPGELKTVTFTLGPDELSFLDRDMHRVVEPGTFDIMVGGNSVDLIQTKLSVEAK
jgi:beta-glucosidase